MLRLDLNDLLQKFSFAHSPEVIVDAAVISEQVPMSDAIPSETPSFRKKNPDVESVIAEDLVIDGSVTSKSNVTIHGVINGDVNCEGNVNIHGAVDGNISGDNVYMSSSHVKGDVKAQAKVVLNSNGSVAGSMKAGSANVDGSVDGNITISEVLVVGRSAVITGDISTASISVAEGAVINGKLSIVK